MKKFMIIVAIAFTVCFNGAAHASINTLDFSGAVEGVDAYGTNLPFAGLLTGGISFDTETVIGGLDVNDPKDSGFAIVSGFGNVVSDVSGAAPYTFELFSGFYNEVTGRIFALGNLFITQEVLDLSPLDFSFTSNQGLIYYGETSPTPVPGAIWLLGTGLVGMVGLRRRMRA